MDAGQAIGARLARRDETALADAYAAYAPSVLAYLRRHVGHSDAEDALQRTFIDVWRSAARYDPQQRFTGWLFTIAHRRAVDTLRQRRHDVVDVESLRGLVGEDGRETVERWADAADVRSCLERLPEHEREVLLLAYYGGLTQTEIAARLDIPLGTVKSRATRGTRRLADLLRGDSLPSGGTAPAEGTVARPVRAVTSIETAEVDPT
jgi:RNA polymerase sigma-70 factor (ECF subfamily)